jgi:uncharacterized membrane protein
MTTGEPPAQPPQRGLSTGRLEALSDGVFAIAITLLVLDIAVPAHAGNDLLGAVTHQWPAYLAYGVSFSTIGALWLGHNVITEYLDRADAVFVRLNLLLLFLVALLPFPTRLFADYLGEEKPERVAATIYGLCLLVASTLLWVLWRYAVHARLVRPDMADEEVELLTQRLTPGLGGYVLLIVVGLFVPIIAVAGYLAIALFYVIPFRRWTRVDPFGLVQRRRRRRNGAARP